MAPFLDCGYSCGRCGSRHSEVIRQRCKLLMCWERRLVVSRKLCTPVVVLSLLAQACYVPAQLIQLLVHRVDAPEEVVHGRLLPGWSRARSRPWLCLRCHRHARPGGRRGAQTGPHGRCKRRQARWRNLRVLVLRGQHSACRIPALGIRWLHWLRRRRGIRRECGLQLGALLGGQVIDAMSEAAVVAAVAARPHVPPAQDLLGLDATLAVLLRRAGNLGLRGPGVLRPARRPRRGRALGERRRRDAGDGLEAGRVLGQVHKHGLLLLEHSVEQPAPEVLRRGLRAGGIRQAAQTAGGAHRLREALHVRVLHHCRHDLLPQNLPRLLVEVLDCRFGVRVPRTHLLLSGDFVVSDQLLVPARGRSTE
mmetsp:Transcript_25251/g.71197  ORF Transcript_25251/g.71197 Transcript_25251/m.71197 type:complete len:365 (+) Transcript_25251:126-1220(+)